MVAQQREAGHVAMLEWLDVNQHDQPVINVCFKQNHPIRLKSTWGGGQPPARFIIREQFPHVLARAWALLRRRLRPTVVVLGPEDTVLFAHVSRTNQSRGLGTDKWSG